MRMQASIKCGVLVLSCALPLADQQKVRCNVTANVTPSKCAYPMQWVRNPGAHTRVQEASQSKGAENMQLAAHILWFGNHRKVLWN